MDWIAGSAARYPEAIQGVAANYCEEDGMLELSQRSILSLYLKKSPRIRAIRGFTASRVLERKLM